MKYLDKAEVQFLNAKEFEIKMNAVPRTLTIDTNKISIYDRTLDLIIDSSNIDLNSIKSIIINGVTFTNESKEQREE